jgi:hypothetical protein
MHGVIPPFPNTPSWRGAQKTAQEQIYLYLYKIQITKLVRVKKTRIAQVQKIHKTYKCRKYDTKYLPFRFIDIDVEEERPQCLLCMRILAADSAKSNKLIKILEQFVLNVFGKTSQFNNREINEYISKNKYL